MRKSDRDVQRSSSGGRTGRYGRTGTGRAGKNGPGAKRTGKVRSGQDGPGMGRADTARTGAERNDRKAKKARYAEKRSGYADRFEKELFSGRGTSGRKSGKYKAIRTNERSVPEKSKRSAGYPGHADKSSENVRYDRKLQEEAFYTGEEAGNIERGNAADRVEGKNPVIEALKSDRALNKLFIERGNTDPVLLRIAAMAREKKVPIQYFDRRKLDSMSQTRIHQGVILEVAAKEYVEVEDILAAAAEKGENPFVLVLDEITDTNNLGSIIRSAECAGVHGIIIPKRRSATLNATVAKVAAGALEYVPVARVTNLVQTLRELKGEGLWAIGADMDGESIYYDADLKGPCALVIGSEGEGIGRLVKNECDMLVKIPMRGKISSLNAGVAAALIMFEISKQRG